MSSVDDAFIRLDALAASVGLSPMEHRALQSLRPPVASIRVWHADYALVVAVPMEASKIDDSWLTIDGWIDGVLVLRERQQKRVVDAYVVFLATGAKERTISNLLELNRSICRKYVVWPESNDDPWSGLSRVSVLGLPQVSTSLGKSDLPVPSDSLEPLWRSIIDPDKDKDAIDSARDLSS